ncbi:MAG: M14 family metallopeptidase [Longimicrobiales bacterium]
MRVTSPRIVRCCLIALLLLLPATATAQRVRLDTLLTRAERSNYFETSRYDEVLGFLRALETTTPRLHLSTFGYTTEGRALPLAVWGDVADATPEAVRAAGGTRVFVQANIHAGEVEGKEAMQVMLRALAAGQHEDWADSLVLLIAPIYNADGNERVALTNRPYQFGPFGGTGQRANAQGLDLNRDHVKLDSPEARSLALLFRRYDPHVVIDLHTTNGTLHAYHLTYSPPLHPNTHPAITTLLRERWLPEVTRVIQEKYDWDVYYYGNVPEADEAEPGWYTFDHRPRFNNNYVGLRNRFAILSEAYAYAPFRERILATLRFVEEILEFAHAHASEIRHTTELADSRAIGGQTLALRAVPERAAAPVEILLGDVARETNPFTGEPYLRRLDVRRTQRMPEYGTFRASEVDVVPQAYLVPPELEPIIERLEAHGVRMVRLARETALSVEQFRIDSIVVAERPFQGRHEHTLFGSYEALARTVPSGTAVVPTDQPLGRLIFQLLEPRSDDGFLSWDLLEGALDDARTYPILRTSVPVG